MRSKCKDWTTSGEVFAVRRRAASGHDDNQLCITEEGHIPLISSWTTVTDWTERGAPYLWWTGPDQADVVLNLVPWGQREGLLTPETKFAILAGDRAGDQLAVNDYLLPALRAVGLKPTVVDTITASIDDPSTAQSQAKSAVSKLKSEGVETVIPLLPVNAFRTYLAAAKAQSYTPKLLLSDYESTRERGARAGRVPVSRPGERPARHDRVHAQLRGRRPPRRDDQARGRRVHA